MESETILMRPIYWEISHAIELALKAFLLSTGMTEGELRGPAVRHNLRELLDRALANDLALPNDVIGVIQGLSPAHAAFYFRYGHEEPADGQLINSVEVPAFWDAMTAAKSLFLVCSDHIARI
jgi:hypothetical protein